MVDVEYIKKFLSEDPSIPFIERGDIIPLEITSFVAETKSYVRFQQLFKRTTSETAKIRIPIEFLCPECGRKFIFESTLSSLQKDIENSSQKIFDVVHDGPRLCPECHDGYFKPQLEILGKKKEEEEERIREDRAEKNRMKYYYLQEPKEDSAPTSEDYLALCSFMNSLSWMEKTEFLTQCGSWPFEEIIFKTRYWNIITAERLRRERNPKCTISGKMENLLAFPKVNNVSGLEVDFKTDLVQSFFVVSRELVDKYHKKRLYDMLSHLKNNQPPKIRAYYMDEILEFGKHEGEKVLDVLVEDRSYLNYIHTNNNSFDVLDDYGCSIFEAETLTFESSINDPHSW